MTVEYVNLAVSALENDEEQGLLKTIAYVCGKKNSMSFNFRTEVSRGSSGILPVVMLCAIAFCDTEAVLAHGSAHHDEVKEQLESPESLDRAPSNPLKYEVSLGLARAAGEQRIYTYNSRPETSPPLSIVQPQAHPGHGPVRAGGSRGRDSVTAGFAASKALDETSTAEISANYDIQNALISILAGGRYLRRSDTEVTRSQTLYLKYLQNDGFSILFSSGPGFEVWRGMFYTLIDLNIGPIKPSATAATYGFRFLYSYAPSRFTFDFGISVGFGTQDAIADAFTSVGYRLN